MPRTPQSQLRIQSLHAATEPLLALNNDHSIELSALTLPELDQIIRASFFSATINNSEALLISFDQSSAYQHVNFLWFRERYDRFVYVDRVVVSRAARGKGYARALYLDLFERSKSAGHSRIVCGQSRSTQSRLDASTPARLPHCRLSSIPTAPNCPLPPPALVFQFP
jgi:predicted GNAT superfamily acetyltransferase